MAFPTMAAGTSASAEGDLRGLDQAPYGQDGEPRDAHGQEVQRGRAPELVLREAARGEEQDYGGTGEPGRGGERPAGRAGDERTPTRIRPGQPDVPHQEQGGEDHDGADPQPDVDRGRSRRGPRRRPRSRRAPGREAPAPAAAAPLPGIPHHRRVDKDREDGRQHHDRPGLVDEQQNRRADQGQPEPRKPRDHPRKQRRKQRHEQGPAQQDGADAASEPLLTAESLMADS